MKLIVGDIGNTVSKLCIVDKKNYKILKTFNLKTKKITSKRYLKNFFKNKKTISDKTILKTALFASVVPSVYLIFKEFFKQTFKTRTLEIKDKQIKQLVKINMKKPHQVGSDRIANASGAYRIYKSNCIIVDFGTATTFDVVTKNGIYKGGVIAPGIELSLKTLYEATAKLPLIKIRKIKKVVGKNTLEAMSSGFFWGYLGLVKNIINGIRKESKKSYKLICTGGFANLFAKSIHNTSLVNRDITVKGILEIYKMNVHNL